MLMRLTPGVFAVACTVLAAACTTTVTTPPPPDPPRIVSFTATPSSIRAGETVQLAWETANTDKVELVDQRGEAVTLSGDGATVTPAETTVYVLRVSGPGGRDSAYVRVRVDAVDSLFLVAVPSEIASGEEVSLVWSALGALSGATLRDSAGTMVPITGASGLVTVKPARSTTYTLTAMQGGGQPALTLQADVKVRPVITSLTATPPAALSGETISLEWNTAGADRVTLREATFGELHTSTTNVDTGTFDFTVPGAMPGDGGTALPQGFPLSFTLEAATNTPVQTVSRTLPSTVGRGPQIHAFDLPEFATEQTLVNMGWRASAVRVELLADGQLVYGASGMAAETGSTLFPAPAANVTFSLVAYDANGLTVRRDRTLKVVKRPEVMVFTAPVMIFSGNAANVTWQTRDAATITVRLKNGPVIFTTNDPARLATGMAQVRLSRPSDLVLEAINAAGDRDVEVKTVDVTQPAMVSVTPEPAWPGFDVTFTWDLTAQAPIEVQGVPSDTPQAVTASTEFFDLSQQPLATAIVFPNVDESVVAVRPPSGFVFPFLDTVTPTFWVSTNGWVALEANTTPRPDNLELDVTTTALPAMLAPWWDNLQLGSKGSVLWMVDGTTFPRRLTIQWDKVLGNSDSMSELTFQVQLYETGRFRFLYRRLAPGSVVQGQGETASIGFTGGTGKLRASYGFNEAVAAEGLELDWFTSASPVGSFVSRVNGPGIFTPFFTTGTGVVVPAPLRTRVFGKGSLAVTEAMPISHPIVPLGRYVEVYNPGADPVDIGGLELLVADAGLPPFTIPSPRIVPAGGFYVVGESTMPADNGDAPVQEAWPMGALNLTPSSILNLRVPGVTDGGFVGQLAWGGAGLIPVAGTSISGDLRAIRGKPPVPLVCQSGPTTFGQTGSIGTPGARNDSCFGYSLASITPAFEDISATGQKLFTGTEPGAYDDKYVVVPLAPAFPWFGATYSSLTVNTNGWVSVVPFTNAGQVNKDAPAAATTSAPAGTIAIFWDDIDKKTSSVDGSVYTEQKTGYRIIQWHHYGKWSSAGTFDDLNFEIKLFDTGVIEFHYAKMQNGGLVETSDGSGATIWIERSDGSSALPISINQSMPRENTAWRFTPAP